MNDQDESGDDEEVFAQHDDGVGEAQKDENLVENYFNFDDENYLVSNH